MGIAETGKDGRPRVKVGKGDSPRNISQRFRENFDQINWGRKEEKHAKKKEIEQFVFQMD